MTTTTDTDTIFRNVAKRALARKLAWVCKEIATSEEEESRYLEAFSNEIESGNALLLQLVNSAYDSNRSLKVAEKDYRGTCSREGREKITYYRNSVDALLHVLFKHAIYSIR